MRSDGAEIYVLTHPPLGWRITANLCKKYERERDTQKYFSRQILYVLMCCHEIVYSNKKILEAHAPRILHKYVVLIIQQILLLLQLRELQLLLLQ